jgi:hypothetical protein
MKMHSYTILVIDFSVLQPYRISSNFFDLLGTYVDSMQNVGQIFPPY